MTEIKLTLDAPESWVAALRAIHDQTGAGSSPVSQIADQIEKQLPRSAIEEPLAFGSIVRSANGTLYVRVGAAQARPWATGEALRSWDQFDAVEVLRVGVGGQKPLTGSDLSRLSIEANARKNGPRTMRVCISDVAPCGEQDCNSCFPIEEAP